MTDKLKMAELPNELEMQVLRITDGENVPGWTWGACMSACLEWLKGNGFVSLVEGRYQPTEKGRKALAAIRETRDE